MCELLGMSANVPTDICFSFTGLMQRSGVTGPHRDGWGIVFYEGKGIRSFRDPGAGAESPIANLVKRFPMKSKVVISHIRKANRGRVCLENTHPFSRELWGQYWTAAHNGQLKGIKKKRLRFFSPVGTTDSEHAFCWILDEMRRHFVHRPVKPKEVQGVLGRCCTALHALGTFNLLLSDSVSLFAFCSTRLFWITRKAPFGRARLIDADVTVDFQAETTSRDVVTVIASQPLTGNETWNSMVPGGLSVFRNGVMEKIA